jgi:uncharacterized membrane protein YjjB (DUF3815 family)
MDWEGGCRSGPLSDYIPKFNFFVIATMNRRTLRWALLLLVLGVAFSLVGHLVLHVPQEVATGLGTLLAGLVAIPLSQSRFPWE